MRSKKRRKKFRIKLILVLLVIGAAVILLTFSINSMFITWFNSYTIISKAGKIESNEEKFYELGTIEIKNGEISTIDIIKEG